MSGKCAGTCLSKSGFNRFDTVDRARMMKTRMFFEEPQKFFKKLAAELAYLEATTKRLTIRLNGLSDVKWEEHKLVDGKSIYEAFPTVQFIEYTRHLGRDVPANVDVTYSLNERTPKGYARALLESGGKVSAIILGKYQGGTITIDGKEFPVVDGDISDLRHLDPPGHVVSLRYKNTYVRSDAKASKVKPNGNILEATT